MKLAIIGSRNITTEQKFSIISKIYNKIETADILITGGARGVDTLAEECANSLNVKIIIIRPENPAIKADYIKRNFCIVDTADKILAIWDGKSRGTKSVIDYANKINKDIEIIKI